MSETVDRPLSMPDPGNRSMVRIFPMEFWTEPRQEKDGSITGVDWVKWAKPGTTPTIINEAIPRLAKALPSSGPMGETMYHPAWAAIEPAYLAWKRGEEAPANGVPLAAWPALDQRGTKALKAMGIKTVEDFAAIPDGALGRLMLPNARNLQANARHFLEARENAAPMAAKAAEQDEKLAALASENAELREQMAQMLAELRKKAPRAGRDAAPDAPG